ncbi:hypothetical protein GGC65_002442 [Sphingopyxis sp. OAS728]|uniref:nuclear transport factor 2 family protein n=1 Tax=Sphingopyxis sp. OAS728 TaxID=2663823 RepID=UPI00178C04CA|nr:nuclear transport factor 2 family protein [Sphingopyxis sp. OAS728]MBE1527986.1 hypothetical protein [Sphingopyxis sp. OAS728]
MSKRDAREIVETLCTEFAWRLDHGKASEAASLFCETMLFGLSGSQVGRGAFEEEMASRASLPFAAKHYLSNCRVAHAAPAEIEASLAVLICKSELIDGEPRLTTICGDWEIRARPEEGEWRIASLAIVPLVPPG